MSLKNWSTTAASNASVDSINWAEGMSPSAVNNSAREEMAQVKEFFNSITGGTVSGTVGGTVDAITLTTVPNPPQAAYAVNQRYLIKAAGANTITAPTLNVGALGAKTIKLPGGAALIASQWAANDMLLLVYDGTDMILLSGDSSRGAATVTSLTRNTQTGTTYTVLTGDRSKHVTFSNAASIAVTLPQANGTTFGGGWFFFAENIGAGTVTITPTTSTINTASTLVLKTNEWAIITSDNTNYRAMSSRLQEVFVIAVGDETTALTTGTGKMTFRMPFAMTLTGVRASLNTVSSSGTPTIDINENGATILSTKLTIDVSEKTSTTAAVPAVISDSALADDAEITIDIDTAGTGAKGLKVTMYGVRL